MPTLVLAELAAPDSNARVTLVNEGPALSTRDGSRLRGRSYQADEVTIDLERPLRAPARDCCRPG
jgi:hypothetical protein